MSLVTHHDEKIDYDDHNTPNPSRADETIFITPDVIDKETAETLRLSQKVTRDKLAAFYRYLNITGKLALINLDQFTYTKKVTLQVILKILEKIDFRVLQWC